MYYTDRYIGPEFRHVTQKISLNAHLITDLTQHLLGQSSCTQRVTKLS
jgi:hypothetical protein